MARVFLHSLAEEQVRTDSRDLFPVEHLRKSCALGSGRHELVPEAASADIVIFVDSGTQHSPVSWALENVRTHPLYTRHLEKVFVHSGIDHPIPLIQGFYPSIEKRFSSRQRVRSFCYLASPNPKLRLLDPPDRAPYVASFVGSCRGGKPVRERLLAQSADDMPVRDTHVQFIDAIRRRDSAAELSLKQLFVDLAMQSAFMLCPAGVGASSFRIFEAMEMGRAPVVIADDWTPVEGPDWDKFSVRVREKDIPRVRAILRDLLPAATTMGAQARSAWEAHFAPETIFDEIVDQCIDMLASRRVPETVASRFALLHLVRPKHLRMWIRKVRRSLR